jgi:hypothetical protein
VCRGTVPQISLDRQHYQMKAVVKYANAISVNEDADGPSTLLSAPSSSSPAQSLNSHKQIRSQTQTKSQGAACEYVIVLQQSVSSTSSSSGGGSGEGKTWMVVRTYGHFKNLHDAIATASDPLTAQPLFITSPFPRNTRSTISILKKQQTLQQFEDKRRFELQLWLNEVLANYELIPQQSALMEAINGFIFDRSDATARNSMKANRSKSITGSMVSTFFSSRTIGASPSDCGAEGRNSSSRLRAESVQDPGTPSSQAHVITPTTVAQDLMSAQPGRELRNRRRLQNDSEASPARSGRLTAEQQSSGKPQSRRPEEMPFSAPVFLARSTQVGPLESFLAGLAAKSTSVFLVETLSVLSALLQTSSTYLDYNRCECVTVNRQNRIINSASVNFKRQTPEMQRDSAALRTVSSGLVSDVVYFVCDPEKLWVPLSTVTVYVILRTNRYYPLPQDLNLVVCWLWTCFCVLWWQQCRRRAANDSFMPSYMKVHPGAVYLLFASV